VLPQLPLANTFHPPSNRTPIDTGTYRVAKRKVDEKSAKSPKTSSNHSSKIGEVYQTIKTIAINSASQSTPHSEPKLSQDNEENKRGDGALETDQKQVDEVFKSKDTLLEVKQNVCEIVEKVKRSASIRDPKASRRSCTHMPLPPPPKTLPYPLDDAAEQLLEAIAQQRKIEDAAESSTIR